MTGILSGLSALAALVFTAMVVMLLAEAFDASGGYGGPNCAPPMTTRISTVAADGVARS